MPTWAPGSYLIREFSKNVEEFQAKSEQDKSLLVEKTAKNTWRVITKGAKTAVITYKVYAFEMSVRTSFFGCCHMATLTEPAFLCTSINTSRLLLHY